MNYREKKGNRINERSFHIILISDLNMSIFLLIFKPASQVAVI